MLDVVSFFRSIGSEDYCVVKISEQFPQYSSGDDIDLYCYDSDKIGRKVLEWGNKYTKEGLNIRVTTKPEYRHVTVDFMKGKEIELRFDLYGQMPRYKKLLIRPALFESVIEHSEPVNYSHDGQRFTVKVPNIIDDMVLRYLEFIEWYNVRPDKVKHLDFIVERIDEEKKERFLTRLHHYTAIPRYEDNPQPARPIRGFISNIIAKLKGKKT